MFTALLVFTSLSFAEGPSTEADFVPPARLAASSNAYTPVAAPANALARPPRFLGIGAARGVALGLTIGAIVLLEAMPENPMGSS